MEEDHHISVVKPVIDSRSWVDLGRKMHEFDPSLPGFDEMPVVNRLIRPPTYVPTCIHPNFALILPQTLQHGHQDVLVTF